MREYVNNILQYLTNLMEYLDAVKKERTLKQNYNLIYRHKYF